MPSESTPYGKLTLADAIQLGSPATWTASIMPVLVGAALALNPALRSTSVLPLGRSILLFILMLATAVLLQSAVNTLNDYADFKKGTDTADNSVDLVDVPIINKHLNPRDALRVAIGYMVLAAVTGFTVVALTDWVPLVIGLTAACIVVLYSAGPKPISYLPLGEVVSGFVMGELICFSTTYVIGGGAHAAVLIWALPLFFTIANIMSTNNTSDIDRDRAAGRKTLSTIIGARRTARMMGTTDTISLALGLTYAWLFAHPWGLLVMALGVLACAKDIATVYTFKYGFDTRPQAMMRAGRLTLRINAFFALAILLGALLS